MIRPLLLTVLLLSSAALAKGSVFLNGVRIDGTTPVTIDKASVRIDADGDVHLTAPGYRVQNEDGSAVRPGPQVGPETRVIGGPRRPAGRYWLATELSPAARAGYDVDVHINGELAFRIREGDPQLSEEITRRLRAGRNAIRFEARKVGRVGPDDGSGTPFLRIHLGEGVEQSDRIILERPQLTFALKSNERGDRVQELVLEAR